MLVTWPSRRSAIENPVAFRLAGFHVSCPAKDRKSTRLNSSHSQISYAVFCLKKHNARVAQSVGVGALVDTDEADLCRYLEAMILRVLSFGPHDVLAVRRIVTIIVIDSTIDVL